MTTEITGWQPGMLQDDSRELSQCLASKPDARLHAREAAAAIATEQKPNPHEWDDWRPARDVA